MCACVGGEGEMIEYYNIFHKVCGTDQKLIASLLPHSFLRFVGLFFTLHLGTLMTYLISESKDLISSMSISDF